MKYDPPPGVTIVEYEKCIRSIDRLFDKCIIEYIAKIQNTGQMAAIVKKLPPNSKFKVAGKGTYFNDT